MWTEFAPFSEYFEIDHYVGHSERRGVWQTTLEGTSGYLSKSEGLSPVKGGPFDYSDKTREVPIGVYWIRINGGALCSHPSGYYDYIGRAAGLGKGKTPRFQQGIFVRIYDHYRKLLQLPERGKIGSYLKQIDKALTNSEQCQRRFSNQNFIDYADLRAFFFDAASDTNLIQKDIPKPWIEVFSQYERSLRALEDIRSFFSEQVHFRYHHLTKSPKNMTETIAKWEGLALREYFHRYGNYPFLNTQNEVRGLEGF